MSEKARTRIGVVGGTFDPVHSGHLGLARAALEILDLERIDLVPSFQPPHRPDHDPAPPWQRYAMVVLATADAAGLHASDREIRRGGTSWTIDTLNGYAEDGSPLDPVLILGMDAFAEITTWKEPEALASRFDIAVAGRPGMQREHVIDGLPTWLSDRIVPPGDLPRSRDGGRVTFIDIPPVPISATRIRERLGGGRPIRGLVPSAVEAYIYKYHPYG